MALIIKCPECGAIIPNEAKRCPRCGTPVIATTNHVNDGKKVDSVEKDDYHYGNDVQNTKSKKLFVGLGVGMLAIITIIILIIVTNVEKGVSESNTEEENKTTGTCNGHDWVDLGLPSGTKWATCNVGANNPEDNGNYYAWGETEPKETYDWTTYQYCDGSETTLTKYCYDESYGLDGYTDSLTTLEAADDPASVSWGAGWRMPTREEFDELITNCTIIWTTQNGVNGRLFTSNINGNSIFLPAAGVRYGSELNFACSYGYYWSSSLSTGSPNGARYLDFYSGDCYMSIYYRYCGRSVRPVCIQ